MSFISIAKFDKLPNRLFEWHSCLLSLIYGFKSPVFIREIESKDLSSNESFLSPDRDRSFHHELLLPAS